MSDHRDGTDDDEAEIVRRDRTSSGGDAEAAASVEEREAVAKDEDDLFDADTED